MRLLSRLFPDGGTWSPRVARATTEQPTGADGPLSAALTHPPPPSSQRLHAHTCRRVYNVIMRTDGARSIMPEAGRETQSRERCRTVADSNATWRPIMASIVRKTTRRTGHCGQEYGRGYRNRVERRVIGYRDQTEPLRGDRSGGHLGPDRSGSEVPPGVVMRPVVLHAGQAPLPPRRSCRSHLPVCATRSVRPHAAIPRPRRAVMPRARDDDAYARFARHAPNVRDSVAVPAVARRGAAAAGLERALRVEAFVCRGLATWSATWSANENHTKVEWGMTHSHRTRAEDRRRANPRETAARPPPRTIQRPQSGTPAPQSGTASWAPGPDDA